MSGRAKAGRKPQHEEVLTVTSNIPVRTTLLPWELELLLPVARDLLEKALSGDQTGPSAGGSGGTEEED